MSTDHERHTRRVFLERVGEAGAAAAIATGLLPPTSALAAEPQAGADWDTRWIERVRRAKYKAVFDSPSGGFVLDLATRYLNNVDLVHHPKAGEVAVVLNVRTRSIYLGFGDPMWEKYPIGEDYKIDDPETKAPARRNLDWTRVAGPMSEAEGIETLERRGAVLLVCDFALGHLSARLATKTGATADAVHADLRGGLVPGAVLVPSGIYGMAEAQNAGCGFVPVPG